MRKQCAAPRKRRKRQAMPAGIVNKVMATVHPESIPKLLEDLSQEPSRCIKGCGRMGGGKSKWGVELNICQECVDLQKRLADQLSKPAPASAVNHPSHYGGAGDPFEHVKVCRAKEWGYLIGNCTKYLWRAGKKAGNSELQDLEKARWYLDKRIEELLDLKSKEDRVPEYDPDYYPEED